jgi:hypothetical protein
MHITDNTKRICAHQAPDPSFLEILTCFFAILGQHLGVEPFDLVLQVHWQTFVKEFSGTDGLCYIIREYQEFWGLPAVWSVIRNEKCEIEKRIRWVHHLAYSKINVRPIIGVVHLI